MNHGVSSTTWLKERRRENIEDIQAAATMGAHRHSERGINQLLSGLAEMLATVY
jgi:hypothetical protein